jgi:hypothetical protein
MVDGMSDQTTEGAQPAPDQTTPEPGAGESPTEPDTGSQGDAGDAGSGGEAESSDTTPGYVDPQTKADAHEQDAQRLADESS